MVNLRRGIGALVASVLGATLVLGGALPASATTNDPLPPCTYDDVLTPRRQYSDWKKTLLDPYFMVKQKYVPPDLVSTANSGITGGGQVRNLAIEDLRSMRKAAKSAGKPIAVNSAYRSFATQAGLFEQDVDRLGYEAALRHTARPGHSEHQLGTAIDFRSSDDGTWLRRNAWKYGWIMSYPKGKRSVTCYQYEPWHYRYFGRTVAAQIRNSGLTVREWLWRQGYGQPASTARTTLPRAA